MSVDEDIARVGWVLKNYDTVEMPTKDGKQVYSKEFKDKNGQTRRLRIFGFTR